MNVEELTVSVPRKERTVADEAPIAIWPLVEAALDKITADAPTRDAAQAALDYSDGCVALANYLRSEGEHIQNMDYRFRAPLLVLAAQMADEDGGVDSVYDPAQKILHFETDEAPYAFSVQEDWSVDWAEVADEVIRNYVFDEIEDHVWALDRLMSFLDVDIEKYTGGEEE